MSRKLVSITTLVSITITKFLLVLTAPALALELKSDNLEVQVETEILLRNIDHTTDLLSGKVDREHDFFVDKIEVDINVLHNNEWFLKIVVETNELATANEERPFVEEFYIGKKFENLDVYAGRFEIPFGIYKNSFASDHITEELGQTETETEAGLAMRWTNNNVDTNVVVFTENFRSSEPDQNGFSINVNWSPVNNVFIGGGYLSSRKATKGQPELLNLHGKIQNDDWMVMAEYVGTINEEPGNQSYALSIEGKFAFQESIDIGGRLQRTNNFNVIDGGNGSYKEIVLAANYHINKNLKLSIELIRGKEKTNGLGSLATKQAISQLNIVF